MLKKVFSILEENLQPNDTVTIGVSGGPDSIALLDVLMIFKKRFALLRVIVAHLNHGLRGKKSDLDEKFVQKSVEQYQEKYGNFVIFESRKIAIPGVSHLEVRGREERRKFFKELKERYKAKWIITAHHEDDNIESIMLHFLRGSGPAGLAGMQVAKDGYLRPLLTISKKEILTYVKRRKIKYRVDKTNAQNRFRRNLLRNKIFPLLRKINPSFKKTILRNAELFHNMDSWLTKEAQHFLEEQKMRIRQKYQTYQGHRGLFYAKDFRILSPALQKTIIQFAFQDTSKQPYRLSSVKVSEILRLISRNIGKKQVILWQNGRFLLEKGMVTYLGTSLGTSGMEELKSF